MVVPQPDVSLRLDSTERERDSRCAVPGARQEGIFANRLAAVGQTTSTCTVDRLPAITCTVTAGSRLCTRASPPPGARPRPVPSPPRPPTALLGNFGVSSLNVVPWDFRSPPPPPRRRLQAVDVAAGVSGAVPLTSDAAGPRRTLLATDPYLFGSTCRTYTTTLSLFGTSVGISVPFRHQWIGAEAAAREYAESLVKAGTPAWLYNQFPNFCLTSVELVQWTCVYGG